MEYTGASVENISIKKQSDVIARKILSIESTVNLPDGVEILQAGQVLISVDGGETFDVAAVDAEANGILCEPITETGVREVMLVGVAREKYCEGLDDTHKPHLFTNKIILK